MTVDYVRRAPRPKSTWFGENPKGTVGKVVYRARGSAGLDRRGNEVAAFIELVDFTVERETVDHRKLVGYRDLRVRTNGDQDHWALHGIVEPAGTLKVDDVRAFAELAVAWHMNGRVDHCVHQNVREAVHRDPAGRWISTPVAEPCPVTGQEYVWPCPERWYVRELPADVEAAIRAFGAQLAGSSPATGNS